MRGASRALSEATGLVGVHGLSQVDHGEGRVQAGGIRARARRGQGTERIRGLRGRGQTRWTRQGTAGQDRKSVV